jgi:hypothetical protein
MAEIAMAAVRISVIADVRFMYSLKWSPQGCNATRGDQKIKTDDYFLSSATFSMMRRS